MLRLRLHILGSSGEQKKPAHEGSLILWQAFTAWNSLYLPCPDSLISLLCLLLVAVTLPKTSLGWQLQTVLIFCSSCMTDEKGVRQVAFNSQHLSTIVTVIVHRSFQFLYKSQLLMMLSPLPPHVSVLGICYRDLGGCCQ
jgi:hypothetical protein